MAFEGWLIKNNSNNVKLNNKLLADDGYKSTPDIQQDKDSYTDDNGDLKRNILSHVKQKIIIKFNDFDNTEKAHIQSVFPSRKKISLTYWNDERERYCSAYFYIPDVDWTIRKIDPVTNKRYYKSTEITLISYGESTT